jgi:hypothetical protein
VRDGLDGSADRAKGGLLADGLLALVALFAAAGVFRIASVPSASFLGNVLVDDAYYYLLPARHLIEGKGFSFDGLHRTNGVQPLWASVVTLLAYLVRDRVLLARAACALSGALWVLAGVVLYRALKPWSRGAALLASSGWIVASSWNHVATIGMENGLLALLFALLLLFGTRCFRPGGSAPRPRAGRLYAALGGLAGLLCLARLETAILGLVLGAAVVSGRLHFGEPRSGGPNWRGAILFSLPPVILVGAYVGFGWLYFGEPIAISGPVKLFYERSFALDNLVVGAWFERVLAQLGLLTDGSFWASTAWLEPLTPRARVMVTAGRLAALAVLIGGGALGCLLGRWRGRERGGTTQAFVGSVALFLGAHLTLVAGLLPQHAAYGVWYFPCEMMGLWAGAALSLSGLLRLLPRRLATPALAACTVAMVVSARDGILNPPAGVAPDPGPYIRSAAWMERNLPGGQRIASIGAGAQAYLAPSHTQINLDGLMNDGEYFRGFLKQPRLAEYLRRERVGYIGESMSLAALREGFDWANGSIPAEDLDLVWWLHTGSGYAYCLLRLWPGEDAYPRDAPSRIQFDAEVRGRYRLIPEGRSAEVGPDERIVTSVVSWPSTELRHVVAKEAQLGELDLSLQTVHPTRLAGAVFGGRLRLVGVDMGRAAVAPGGRLAITRFWEMLEDGHGFPAVTIETVIEPPGAPADQPPLVVGERPCHGTSAVGRWRRGEVVTETSVLALPAEWEPGLAAVSIRLRLENGEAMGLPAFVGNVEIGQASSYYY